MLDKIAQRLNIAVTAVLLTSTIIFHVEYNARPVNAQSSEVYTILIAKN